MVDALSGGSESERSEDGLSNGSDSDDTGVAAGEISNVINSLTPMGADIHPLKIELCASLITFPKFVC
jgi:hypothetical protein